MKKFSVSLGVLLLSLFVYVHIYAESSPFPSWVALIKGSNVAAMGSFEGDQLEHVAVFTYDVATDLGTVAAHGLGVYLPAKAVITRSYFKIITQFVDAGSGTVALSCEDANNIKTATDITGSSANAFVEGASTGASSAFVRGIAARCQITATVATAAQTAGKLIGWVHYVVED